MKRSMLKLGRMSFVAPKGERFLPSPPLTTTPQHHHPASLSHLTLRPLATSLPLPYTHQALDFELRLTFFTVTGVVVAKEFAQRTSR